MFDSYFQIKNASQILNNERAYTTHFMTSRQKKLEKWLLHSGFIQTVG